MLTSHRLPCICPWCQLCLICLLLLYGRLYIVARLYQLHTAQRVSARLGVESDSQPQTQSFISFVYSHSNRMYARPFWSDCIGRALQNVFCIVLFWSALQLKASLMVIQGNCNLSMQSRTQSSDTFPLFSSRTNYRPSCTIVVVTIHREAKKTAPFYFVITLPNLCILK